MTEEDDPILDSARRLFQSEITPAVRASAEHGEFQQGLWNKVEEFGLPLALVPDDAGGIGLSAVQAFGIVGLAGTFAVPLPIPEAMLANRLLALAGLGCREGPLTVATGLRSAEMGPGRWRVEGRVKGVPWAGSAEVVAVLDTDEGARVVLLPRSSCQVVGTQNIAREPRDQIVVDAYVTQDEVDRVGLTEDDVQSWLAAARCSQMAGAMQRIAAMTVDYAQQRQQFGKPLGKFQAIQQNLAVLWENSLAATAAARLAAEAVDAEPLRKHAVAAAKIRTGEAAGIVASIAHQVHGAIGFTDEYPLHHLTRRLWSWREEYGNETYWAGRLGRVLASGGGDGLWPAITTI